MRLRYIIMGFFLVTLSCQQVRDCQLDPSRDYMIVQFFNLSDSTAKPVLFEEVINPDSPYNFINPEDSSTYTGLALPLNPADTLTEYIFDADSQVFHLTIKYQTLAYLYSLDCDAVIRYNNLRVTDHTFDSVAVVTDELYEFLTNVEIYF